MISNRFAATSPRAWARIAGVFYLLDLVSSLTGDTVLHTSPLGVAADRFATACYLVVTLLLFGPLKIVNRTPAFLMAAFSLVALTVWTFGHTLLDGSAFGIGNVAFGVYCLLAGYLIYRSRLMPRVLGAAMALGGLGLLTYGSPELVKQIYPYNVIPALIGETALMISLLVVGVDAERWRAKAGHSADLASLARATPAPPSCYRLDR